METKNELAFVTEARNVQGSVRNHDFVIPMHVRRANGVMCNLIKFCFDVDQFLIQVNGLFGLSVAKVAALGISIGPASAITAHARDLRKTNDPAISRRVRLENGVKIKIFVK